MNRFICFACVGFFLSLSACFSREERPQSVKAPAPVAMKKATETPPVPHRDKSLDVLVRYLGEADSIHREAWWVLNNERPPVGKSPFGKVQRAFLASQNIKLTNKSLFRCDRYVVQKMPGSAAQFPQDFSIFEKCSEKIAAKKIASVKMMNEREVQVLFLSENLEEILGLGATVLSLHIECSLRGDGQGHLQKLTCKDWAQDRSREQMIRLSVYDYEKAGKNLLSLRGKVFENLTDIRKIEAEVPLDGKIFVTETELYPPEPTPTPKASPAATAKPVVTQPKVLVPPPIVPRAPEEGGEAVEEGMEPNQVEGAAESGAPVITPLHLPPPRVSPASQDELMQQIQNDLNNPQAPVPQEPEAGGVNAR